MLTIDIELKEEKLAEEKLVDTCQEKKMKFYSASGMLNLQY